MKNYIIFAMVIVFHLLSCQKTKQSQNKKDLPQKRVQKLSRDSQIFLGNRLFSEKTCIKCHDVNKHKVGPSIKKIMHIYRQKNGSIVNFLKGDAKPIVDSTASQVAIMQDNINGFIKGLSDEEIKTIATYMMYVDKLNK